MADASEMTSPKPPVQPIAHTPSSAVSASLEDDLDELINSCFSNSPALSIKPLPVPPSLSFTPSTPMSLGDDDDDFMAWLNEEKPAMSPIPPAASAVAEGEKPVETKLEKAFDEDTVAVKSEVAVDVSAPASSAPVESEPSPFMQGLTKRLSLFKQESISILDQVSAASAVAREKAVELAETGRQIAAQKYTEFVEERAKVNAAAVASPSTAEVRNSSAFTIDDEEENDDISGLLDESMSAEERDAQREAERRQAVAAVDPDKINVSRTELEKAYALAMHALAGLRPGDSLLISKDTLPGATLFPCIMYVPAVAARDRDREDGTDPTEDDLRGVPEHRFLVVTKERFLVLDSSGGKVGSEGVVSVNKHLTELQKMTFKKKSPELITLFFHSPVSYDDASDKATSSAPDPSGSQGSHPVYRRLFRVSKRDLFVNTLQKNMMHFR